MNNKEIIKDIKKEIKTIEKEYDSADWGYSSLSKMNSEEAFSRGYYRALNATLKMLTINEDKNFFQKLQDFMEKENFKLTDQTNNGKDIFRRKEDKVITEIFIED